MHLLGWLLYSFAVPLTHLEALHVDVRVYLNILGGYLFLFLHESACLRFSVSSSTFCFSERTCLVISCLL